MSGRLPNCYRNSGWAESELKESIPCPLGFGGDDSPFVILSIYSDPSCTEPQKTANSPLPPSLKWETYMESPDPPGRCSPASLTRIAGRAG